MLVPTGQAPKSPDHSQSFVVHNRKTPAGEAQFPIPNPYSNSIPGYLSILPVKPNSLYQIPNSYALTPTLPVEIFYHLIPAPVRDFFPIFELFFKRFQAIHFRATSFKQALYSTG